jgi:hypothetical protein
MSGPSRVLEYTHRISYLVILSERLCLLNAYPMGILLAILLLPAQDRDLKPDTTQVLDRASNQTLKPP